MLRGNEGAIENLRRQVAESPYVIESNSDDGAIAAVQLRDGALLITDRLAAVEPGPIRQVRADDPLALEAVARRAGGDEGLLPVGDGGGVPGQDRQRVVRDRRRLGLPLERGGGFGPVQLERAHLGVRHLEHEPVPERKDDGTEQDLEGNGPSVPK